MIKILVIFVVLLLTGIAERAAAWNKDKGEKEIALSLKPNIDNGRKVYEVCSACHMPEGWGLADGTYPQISGQHQSVLIKQLADIRQVNRDNPSMYPFALPEEIGGPQAIADVTAYIESLPMSANNGLGDGHDLALGKQLYEQYCLSCHGTKGEGDKEKFYPRLQGQHYKYLLRQFQWIQLGKRRNANPEMARQIRSFSWQQTKAVLDYVSRLKPPVNRLAPSGWRNPDFD